MSNPTEVVRCLDSEGRLMLKIRFTVSLRSTEDGMIKLDIKPLREFLILNVRKFDERRLIALEFT